MGQNVFDPAKELSREVKESRIAEYPVNPLFLNRWSPKAFSSRKVEEADIYTVLEAARWTPSGGNRQPWRFVIAKTEEELEPLRDSVAATNRVWSDKAPVLIALAAYKLRPDGAGNPYSSLDSGAAWQSLALQATLLGLTTRAIGNFDRDKARKVLKVPEDFDLLLLIPLGYPDEASTLPPELQEKEKPTDRRPLSDSIIVGGEWK